MTPLHRRIQSHLLTTSIAGIATALLTGCGTASQHRAHGTPIEQEQSGLQIASASDLDWSPLNPARGHDGPQAADLWGDRTSDTATGFLVKFAEDFSSPPHIHNTTYRGVVIEGEVHNNDPDAAKLWMPPGSFWTQPAGDIHITAARGNGRIAYIEIQSGPYLVLPSEQASDNGERAINVHASNIVWLDDSIAETIESEGPSIAYLWGDPVDDRPSAAIVKLPEAFKGTLAAPGPTIRAVVITGSLQASSNDASTTESLEPGSYVGSVNDPSPSLAISTTTDAWLYVRNEGRLRITGTHDR